MLSPELPFFQIPSSIREQERIPRCILDITSKQWVGDSSSSWRASFLQEFQWLRALWSLFVGCGKWGEMAENAPNLSPQHQHPEQGYQHNHKSIKLNLSRSRHGPEMKNTPGGLLSYSLSCTRKGTSRGWLLEWNELFVVCFSDTDMSFTVLSSPHPLTVKF